MHIKYVDRGLQSIHWTAMESAMIVALKQYIYECNALATEQQKKTVAKLWKNLIHYIIQTCREGFDEAIRNQNDASDGEDNANSKPWWNKCIS